MVTAEAALQFDLPFDPQALERGWPLIEAFLDRHAAEPRIGFVANLVFEEILTNIERHAPAGGCSAIHVALALAPDGLQLEIADDGPAFDPCAIPQPPADPAREGGRGIHLMRRMTRRMRYRREQGWNRLEVLITPTA